MKKIINFTILASLLCVLIPTKNAYAIFVSPKRLIIENNKRSAEVILHNQENHPIVARFEWEHYRMNENGTLTALKEGETIDGFKPADPYLRFSPRQIILQPGQSQSVRIMVTRKPEMIEGEYRTHFLIKQEPIKPKKTNANQGENQNNVSGQIELTLHKSIPVFLHNGETKVDFEVEALNVIKKNDKDFIRYAINNNSTRTVYASPILSCALGNDTKRIKLTNIRLYADAKRYVREIALRRDLGFDVRDCSTRTIRFYDAKDFQYSRTPMKSAPLNIQ